MHPVIKLFWIAFFLFLGGALSQYFLGMSYPRSLDEYTTVELREELQRRAALRDDERCDYCGRRNDTTPCRFPGRHKQDL